MRSTYSFFNGTRHCWGLITCEWRQNRNGEQKLIERSEAELTADALIEILAERDSQKALELYKEWTASQDQSSSAEVAEI